MKTAHLYTLARFAHLGLKKDVQILNCILSWGIFPEDDERCSGEKGSNNVSHHYTVLYMY